MKRIQSQDLIGNHYDSWKILATTSKSQAALMTLRSGETSGEYGTEHPASDQWLFCLTGSGSAFVEGERIEFGQGDLLLIEAGENHQVVGGPCQTLNLYAPVAYPDED